VAGGLALHDHETPVPALLHLADANGLSLDQQDVALAVHGTVKRSPLARDRLEAGRPLG
jgi:hypothetical protein